MYEVLVCGLCGVCVVTVLPDLYVNTPPTASNTLLQLPQFSKKFLPTILVCVECVLFPLMPDLYVDTPSTASNTLLRSSYPQSYMRS